MNYKEELINRYMYLYENASYILAPFMEEKENNRKNKKGNPISNSSIRLNHLDKKMCLSLEEFMFSDKKYSDTFLYKYIESNKKNEEYLEEVYEGLKLLEKENKRRNLDVFRIKLDMSEILNQIRSFINGQSSNGRNKNLKLKALDEYFKINRYANDGHIYTSGYATTSHDFIHCPICHIGITQDMIDFRSFKNIGLKNTNFINYLAYDGNKNSENGSILSEDEKQEIYLHFHDEIPWNLDIYCNEDGNLTRPINTYPCEEKFFIREEEIFTNGDEFYQLCPHCGYIVRIPAVFLSDGVKNRIKDRCSKDNNLFRKMYLYSELFSLDRHSTKGQKRVLKK